MMLPHGVALVTLALCAMGSAAGDFGEYDIMFVEIERKFVVVHTIAALSEFPLWRHDQPGHDGALF